MKYLFIISMVVIYYIAIGVVLGKAAGFIGSIFNFTGIFKFFQKLFRKSRGIK